MKKRTILTALMALSVLVVCLTLLPVEAQAAETSGTCGENVIWTLNSNGTLTISGTGDMNAFSLFSIPWSDYQSKIINVVIQDGVTSIGDYSFHNCTALVNITIPDSVTYIGYKAIHGCSNLSGVWVSKRNQNYACDAHGALFNKDMTLLITAPVSITGNYSIPDGVRSIGEYAFDGCAGVTGISIPNSVTHISDRAFNDCTNLTSITIPNSVDSIHMGVFAGCTSLNNITLHNGTTRIYPWAFAGCTTLTNIAIPNSVSYIGAGAFSGCTSLASITLPNSVTEIYIDAFENCNSMWHILYTGTAEQWNNIAFYRADNTVASFQESDLANITLHFSCSGDEVTDIANKHCTICANCSHTWGKGNVTKEPTCAGEGEIIYICTVCGDSKTESIAKLSSHSYDSGKITKEPTIEAEGETTYTCTVCGSTKTESIAKLSKPENSILEITDGTFEYHSAVTGELETYTFDYSDTWLLKDSTNYNHDLAKMSIRMAMSAARTTPGSIEKLFSTLKFTETTIDYPSPKEDTIGYAIGSKTILAEDGKEYTLIAVAVRGGGYESEWASNFTIGNTSEHQGFSDAAEKVCKAVESHIKKIGAKKNIKVWITGYSRAAATSNIAAHNLTANAKNGRIKGLSADSVFAYCFECPRTVRTDHPSYATKDNNIFNIVNAIDLVPMVAPQAWKFDRYGTTYYLPASEVNYKGFQTAFSKMKTEYGLILSHVGSDTNLSSLTAYSKSQCTDLNDVIDALAAYFWDQSTYVLGYQSTVADSLKSFTGGDFEIKAVTELVLGVVPAFPILHPIATAKLIGNLGNVACAHYPELCLAWMDSLSGKEEYVDSRTRYLRINCPVDISVYDSNGILVAQIVNDVVQEIESSTIGAVVDENGQKVVVLPPDEAFKVVVTATNDGTMSYQIEEHDIGTGNSTRVINYYDVDIQKDDELNGTIGIQSTADTMYALVDSDGKQIGVTNDLHGDEISEYTICVNADGSGTVTGGGICTVGEYVQLSASANGGHVFLGWYIDEQLVSHEAAYRFRAEDSVSITGRFDAEQPITVPTTIVAPTTTPVTTVAPTTVPATTVVPTTVPVTTVVPTTAPVETTIPTTVPETTIVPVETTSPATTATPTTAPAESTVPATEPKTTIAPTTAADTTPPTTVPATTAAPTEPVETPKEPFSPAPVIIAVVVIGLGGGAYLWFFQKEWLLKLLAKLRKK